MNPDQQKHAALDTSFLKDGIDMIFYGFFRDSHLIGNLLVGHTPDNEDDNLLFSPGYGVMGAEALDRVLQPLSFSAGKPFLHHVELITVPEKVEQEEGKGYFVPIPVNPCRSTKARGRKIIIIPARTGRLLFRKPR